MPTLYHAVLSPCAQKVRLVLAEKRIEWTDRTLDLMNKENLEPWYLELAPKGLVPALEDGGEVVTESTVICEYLEDRHPRPSLRAESPLDRARMRSWMRLVDDVVHPSAGPIIFGGLARERWLARSEEERERLLSRVPDPKRRERQRAAIAKGLDADEVEPCLRAWAGAVAMLEARLARADWLAGDAYSLADAAVTPYVFFMDALGMRSIFERHPGVRTWFDRVRARPSFATALLDPIPSGQRRAIEAIAERIGPGLSRRIEAASAAAS